MLGRSFLGPLVGLLVICSAAAKELTGRQIMDEVTERQEKPYEFEVQTMTLSDRSGTKEVRTVKRYVRKIAEGEFKYLMVFHEPSGIKGVALLTWQHNDKDDDQWMYMPAYGKKTKRIAKGGRKNYFMGTDYTFEDLVSESRDKFTYERRPDEVLDGVSHFVVDVYPKDPQLKKETGYKYRTVWVRKDIFFITRTDYFDKRGKLIKRQTAGDLFNVEGQLWRSKSSYMDNFKKNHATRIEVVERDFDKQLVPEKIFRGRYLTSGKHVR